MGQLAFQKLLVHSPQDPQGSKAMGTQEGISWNWQVVAGQ